jgi:D-3-phosphoglycerate dehydrogenase
VEDAVFGSSGLEVTFAQLEVESEDELIAACAGAHALMPANADVSARVLDALPDCRIVAVAATGFDCVDLAAATARGIVVTHVAGYCTTEVADHAMAFLLDLGRNLSRLRESVRAGVWEYEACGRPARLGEQSLGIIGLGRIGSAVARRAQAFGLRLLASDPYVADSAMASLGVEKSGLDEVLACDYVTLHCVLTDETRRIVDAAALARMRPSAFLLNTARGACVDTGALTAALAEGRIAGAALDVTDPEPLPDGHPLYEMPSVLLTPHAAFLSRASDAEVRGRACTAVVRALRGEVPDNVVNPEVLGRDDLRLGASRPR